VRRFRVDWVEFRHLAEIDLVIDERLKGTLQLSLGELLLPGAGDALVKFVERLLLDRVVKPHHRLSDERLDGRFIGSGWLSASLKAAPFPTSVKRFSARPVCVLRGERKLKMRQAPLSWFKVTTSGIFAPFAVLTSPRRRAVFASISGGSQVTEANSVRPISLAVCAKTLSVCCA
jgi:hypothetical protein